MKKILFFAILSFSIKTWAQVTAKDCSVAVNVCTSNSFSIDPNGTGFVDFTTASNISNPTNNPAGIVPTGGMGCLKAGELNPTWMIINIQTPGTLEFSMGAGSGQGAQSGCYDWIMWPYNATTCGAIFANTLPPVRCCWNTFCSGGTGLASAANLPQGGFAQDYGAPLNVNCGDKFIMCFSNYSSVSTLVPLNFFGTAIVSCSALQNSLTVSSKTICTGAAATLSVIPSSGTTYSWNTGATTSSIVVSPTATTVYTITAINSCGVMTGTAAVVVSSAMNLNLTSTNGNCSTGTQGSASVSPTGGIPSYTYSWSPSGGTGATAGPLSGGVYTITVTDAIGCKAAATVSITGAVPLSFSISASSKTIVCNPNFVTLNAVNTSTLSNVNYTWTSVCSNSATGASYNATAACTYSVFGYDPIAGSCVAMQLITITLDNAVATASVNPGTGIIQCGLPATTFTGSPAPLSNYTYQWYPPCGPPFTGYICLPGCAGIYTFEVTNTLNGCKSTKTATVTSNSSVPTMTVTAQNNNYYVTCVTCVTMQIQGGISGGGGTGTRWLDQTMTNTLTTSNTYSTCVPGNYVAYVYALSAPQCSVAQMVTVLSNTTPPTAAFTSSVWGVQNPTLTCYDPCVTMTGTSTATSYSVNWLIPAAVPDATLSVCSTTNQSQTTVSTPTVKITDLVNGCVKLLPVPVYQDIKTVGLTAKSTPSLLTCKVLQTALQFTPNPLTASFTWTWTTPPPTNTITQLNPIYVYAPGMYTVEVTSTFNGCKSQQTVNVGLNNLPPAYLPVPNATLACGSPTVQISSGVTSTVGMIYFWDGPPGSAIASITSANPNVNMVGLYNVQMTNTITGCRSTNSVYVVPGTLDADFIPDPDNGYAPLSVNFINTTNPTGGSSYWGYGNGISQNFSITVHGSTTYNSPGTYTVILISQKGVCIDTAIHTVKVDIPSKLEVPNVFTPNGDGINDNFILHTANLSDITATVYDRWGLKIYEVTTDKGNISWDGKNLGGSAVPSGTYFWIVKANGKDGVAYEEKGTVTLYK